MSSFKIKQIAKSFDNKPPLGVYDPVNLKYLTPITFGSVDKYESLGDSDGNGNQTIVRKDECVKVNLTKGSHYYFHSRVKRATDIEQKFNIKLAKTDNTKGKQFIKQINVAAGSSGEYLDIDCVFTAAADFDAIVFELVGSYIDFTPIIIFIELSEINNILGKDIAVKMGIQAKPGLLMCINGQEIRVGYSGIYELQQGVIKGTQFSVVNPADVKDLDTIVKDTEESICLFSQLTDRSIPPFVLNYICEVED